MNPQRGRPSRIVPILVALIGALGVIVAAWIGVRYRADDDGGASDIETVDVANDPETVPPDTGTEPPVEDPPPLADISGEYRLDPDSNRIIVLEATGEGSYKMWEKDPAPWPFIAEIEYVGNGEYRGPGDFTDSQAAMEVVVRPQENGVLATQFVFTRGSDGSDPEGRVDPHALTPLN